MKIGWTNGILCTLNKWNCSYLSTRGMCSTAYKVLNIMNDHSFMYHMFSPFNLGKANLGCDTNWVSNLICNNMRSKGFNKVGGGFLGTYDWNLI